IGGGRVHCLARAVGQFFRRDFHLLHAHAVGILRFLGVAVLALILLAVALAGLVLVFLGIARALVAHFERVEQIMDDVAEAALLLHQLLHPVGVAAGPPLHDG